MFIMQAVSRVVVRFSRSFPFPECSLIASGSILIAGLLFANAASATVVRMETSFGNIDIELYDNEAPKTVANFLRYAGRGNYTGYNGFFHRSVPGFILQAGGYTAIDFYGQYLYVQIPLDPPVKNEFSSARSNTRGTIAMAKLPGNPDSATSEWFINLADNSANLDIQNGGFTVFGRVIDPGMDVVTSIARIQTYNAAGVNSSFTNIPLINYDPTVGVMQPSNLVTVTRIPNVAAARVPSGEWAIFTADVGMTFDSLGTVDPAMTVERIGTFNTPSDRRVHFNNEMITMSVSGSSKPVIIMYDGASTRPTHYYAYGPTLDNRIPHWYDFTFDGTTGAEIRNDRIVLHFVDGGRGDDDLVANNSITHTGAQAVVTAVPSANTKSGGCSIASKPSQAIRGGDWLAVFLFLACVVFVRRHRRQERN